MNDDNTPTMANSVSEAVPLTVHETCERISDRVARKLVASFKIPPEHEKSMASFLTQRLYQELTNVLTEDMIPKHHPIDRHELDAAAVKVQNRKQVVDRMTNLSELLVAKTMLEIEELRYRRLSDEYVSQQVKP